MEISCLRTSPEILDIHDDTKHGVALDPQRPDEPEADLRDEDKELYDPFASRAGVHLTTDSETMSHLLRAYVGTGILAMPVAFQHAGLVMGVIAAVVVGVVSSHTAVILVKSTHALYRRLKVPSLSFPDVGEMAFLHGPAWARKYSVAARFTILVGTFSILFGTCSVYTVIIGYNFQQVIENYTGTHTSPRVYIAALLVPLVLLSWVPNLKYLAPVSFIANVLMGIVLIITFYHLIIEVPPVTKRPKFASIRGVPVFLGITIFAAQAIGVVMPLENQMENPANLLGVTGILNKSVAAITLVYIAIGFLGYLKYGDDVKGSITLNLPLKDTAAQLVKILTGLSIFLSYGLRMMVCQRIFRHRLENRFPNHPLVAVYTARTILVSLTVLLAVTVPTIGPFIGLVGALCYSVVGIIIPPVIEVVTFWSEGFGYAYYKIWKNIIIVVLGVVSMISGSYMSILEIVALYHEKS